MEKKTPWHATMYVRFCKKILGDNIRKITKYFQFSLTTNKSYHVTDISHLSLKTFYTQYYQQATQKKKKNKKHKQNKITEQKQ